MKIFCHRVFTDYKEYWLAGSFFFILTLIFFYRIFLGEVYSPVNLYYHFSPWNAEYTTGGTNGALLSDPIDSFYPSVFELVQSFHRGNLSFWSNNIGLGGPSALETLYFPTNLLFLIVPLNVAPTIDIMLRVFLSQLGMYVMLRSFRLRPASCVLGAVAFVYSMPMIVWLNWAHTRVSMLAPWLLWSARKILAGDNRFVVPTALLTGWMLLGGMPTYAIYYFYIISLYFAYIVFLEYVEKRDLRKSAARCTAYGGALTLGALMATVYVIPFFENMRYTGYMARRESSDIFLENLWKPKYLIHLFDPLYTQTVPMGEHPNEVTNYFGILSLFLFFIAVFLIVYYRKKHFYFFAAASVLIFGCVFSVPGFTLLGKLPFVGSSKGSRLITPFIFIAAIIISKCFDMILDGLDKKALIAGACGSSICMAALFLTGAVNVNGFKLSAGLVTCVVIFVFGMYLLALFQFRHINRQLLCFAIIPVFVFDLFRGGIGYSPSVVYEKSVMGPPTAATDFLEEHTDSERFIALGLWTIFPNASIFYGINDLASHSFMMTEKRVRDFYTAIDDKAYQTATRTSFLSIKNNYLISLAGVKYILENSLENPLNLGAPRKRPVGEFSDGNILKQSFRADKSGLSGITAGFATYGKELTEGAVTYQILDSAGNAIRAGTIQNSDLKDNTPYLIEFEPIRESKGRDFALILFSGDSEPGESPTVWVYDYDQYEQGYLEWNGEDIGNDLIFSLDYIREDLEYITTLSGLKIYENPNALPRAYLTGKVQVYEDPGELWNRMLDEADLSVAYLEDDAGFTLSGGGIREVDELVMDINSFKIKTSAEDDNLLVLAEQYYPGWHVYIDGEESHIYRANYLFNGVFVPNGEHTVEFVYRPRNFFAGAAVSVVVFLGLILSGILIFRKKRTGDADE